MRFTWGPVLLFVATFATLGCKGPPARPIAPAARTAEPVAADAAPPIAGLPAAADGGADASATDATSVTGEAREVLARAVKVVAAIKAKDTRAWGALVHPERGVRFSPYAYVDTKTDRVLRAASLESAFADKTVRAWGAFDGSGNPIQLTFARYYARFVYDVDFANAPQVAVDQPLSSGNTTDNAREAYPDAHVVEFYFPGFDEKFEGMDWRALRLVFARARDTWFLVGVIHSEWTI
jgi:hypothetical protein